MTMVKIFVFLDLNEKYQFLFRHSVNEKQSGMYGSFLLLFRFLKQIAFKESRV
jgi:hypothetical protein